MTPRPAHTPVGDRIIYFVMADFGREIGRAYVERDPARMDRKSTVEDISNGEWGKGVEVVAVLECNPFEKICNDVTEDILREAGRWEEEDSPPLSGQDKIDRRWDHVRDQRKHERA